ncbi:MAG: type 1 glutamine amidotransferase domain-containing protein [Bacteroidota bacterium]
MTLKGKKIVQLVEDMYEDLELWYPTLYLRGEGAVVHITGKKKGQQYTGKHGLPAEAEMQFTDINPDGYDALVIPGGYSPDKLRRHDEALELVRKFNDAGKTIGIICHAGWVPISAGIMNGRKATSYVAIKDDMKNAGVEWVDEEVVKDGNLISSRHPGDLPAYAKALAEAIK